MTERQVYVYIQLPRTLEVIPAALLKVIRHRDGTYIGRFRYGDRYLERNNAIELDPLQLPLGKAVYEFTKLKGIPGAVRDAAPDAWGRRVIEHKVQRGPADLEEIDYLIHGPQDGAGYLSFGLNRDPPPPIRPYNRTHQLGDLIAAAEAIEDGRRVPEHILEQLEPGTSMGGARPKATVEHEGTLWLAKFPERTDRFNLQRIEFATLDLARRCGLNTCRAQLQAVGGRDVLMLERFDRQRAEGGYFRLGFASALTILDAEDSHLSRDRWSYPLLADGIRRYADGWRLSPLYDVVPLPLVSLERRDLALTVGAHGRAASVYNLISQCDRFGLSEQDARQEIRHITAIVQTWRERFAACGVTPKDIDYIAPAMLPPSFLSETAPRPV